MQNYIAYGETDKPSPYYIKKVMAAEVDAGEGNEDCD